MAKPLALTERIANRMAQQRAGPTGKNRAVFLALKPDIQAALADGWPVKTIWETLHEEGKVTFSYQAFRGYVNRLILAPAATPASVPGAISGGAPSPATPVAQTATEQVIPAAVAAPVKRQESTISAGFSFNTQPTKEGLI